MHLTAVESHVWERLSTARKTLVGRRVVGRLVGRAMSRWPGVVLAQCDAAQSEIVGNHMATALANHARREYGMGIIAMLVLGALVQELVKILVQWWLDSREGREAIAAAALEARHHD